MESSKDSNHIPWREMYRSASSIPREDLHSPSLSHRRTKSLSQDQHPTHSHKLNHLTYHSEEEGPKSRSFSYLRDPSLRTAEKAISFSLPDSPSFKFKSHVNSYKNPVSPQINMTNKYSDAQSTTVEDLIEEKGTWTLNPGNFQLAMYVAMAHGILGALVLLMYGIWMLLDDYRKPIQWAILCSMPLREIQRTLVRFWEKPLKQGIVQTIWAIPSALCKAFIGTMMDARIGIHYVQGRSQVKHRRKVDFSTLMQWLVSFAVLTLGYEFLGPAPLVTAAFVGMLVYAAGTSLGVIVPLSDYPDSQGTWTMLSAKHRKLKEEPRLRIFHSMAQFFKLVNTRITSGFLGSLHFVIAVLLILMLIVGSLAGLVLFSYKVGVEGKDAVIALKAHIQKSNYAERAGLKQWIEENKVPDAIETYAGRAYDVVSEHLDGFAAQYNLTDLVTAGKKYILRLARRQEGGEDVSEFSFHTGWSPLFLEKFQKVRAKLGDYDFKGAYYELEQAGLVLLEHFHISKEDLLDKLKQLGKRWVDVGKQVAASSSTLLVGSIYLLVWIAYSIASGAAGVVHFLMQAIVFFSVLYYLIISETGGVMKQVLSIVPLSESTRTRCATVLEDTVSSVLLSTAKAALFQAVFTWLLFRFFSIHFLYMSTFLALLSALLSLPFCFQASTLIGGAQLAVEGRYVPSVLLMVVHIGVVRYAVSKIHKGSPHHHFAGLSLAVGVVLFWHSPERAIMGPLIITVLIAVKNLYLEFVLKAENQI